MGAHCKNPLRIFYEQRTGKRLDEPGGLGFWVCINSAFASVAVHFSVASEFGVRFQI